MNVFEVFLPQLMIYPNPTDPLNGEAAALLLREPERYKMRVRGTSDRPPTLRIVTANLTARGRVMFGG